MSRRVRYQVAVSLDGFIAGPNGEHDWIVMDPAIDFAALFREFDTAIKGRKTWKVLTAQGGHGELAGLEVVVFSRTLRAAACPGVRILNDDPRAAVAALKSGPGRDIWLYGGGEFFRTLLDAGLVDTVEVAVIPVPAGERGPAPAAGRHDNNDAHGSQDTSGQRHRGACIFSPGRHGPRPVRSIREEVRETCAREIGGRPVAIRGIGWAVMAVCALIIASYAAAMFILPGFGPPFVQDLGRGVVRPAAIQRSGHELTITSRMAPG